MKNAFCVAGLLIPIQDTVRFLQGTVFLLPSGVLPWDSGLCVRLQESQQVKNTVLAAEETEQKAAVHAAAGQIPVKVRMSSRMMIVSVYLLHIFSQNVNIIA